MSSPRLRNSVVVLFCSDALATALGALSVEQPASSSQVMAEHAPGMANGTVVAVMATSGENYLWPVRGTA